MRRTAALLLTIGIALTAATVTAAPSLAANSWPSILYAGQSLGTTWPHNGLASPSGLFQLQVGSYGVDMSEFVILSNGDSAATDVWEASDFWGPYQGNGDKSRLVMQRDGNLVIYTSKGHPLWASGTAGTGTSNRLVMQNDGNLVIYTAKGRAVWASGTTAIMLGTGGRLDSGGRMVNSWSYWMKGYTGPSILSMQRDGNLVARCGSRVTWQSKTRSSGAYLRMTANGDLQIVSVRGSLLWHSHTAAGPESWMIAGAGMTIDASTKGPIWSVPPWSPTWSSC